MTATVFDLFDVDADVEKSGIIVEYGNVRFLIARAGGANAKFAKVFKAVTKPYRRQIDNEQISEEKVTALMAEVYARSVILSADSAQPVLDDEGSPVSDEAGEAVTKWVENTIPTRDGDFVPATEKAIVELLVSLPEMFKDIQTMASKAASFRKEEDEEDSGN